MYYTCTYNSNEVQQFSMQEETKKSAWCVIVITVIQHVHSENLIQLQSFTHYWVTFLHLHLRRIRRKRNTLSTRTLAIICWKVPNQAAKQENTQLVLTKLHTKWQTIIVQLRPHVTWIFTKCKHTHHKQLAKKMHSLVFCKNACTKIILSKQLYLL